MRPRRENLHGAVVLRRERGPGRRRVAVVGVAIAPSGHQKRGTSAAHSIAAAIREALSPRAAPGPVRTLADMTPEERAAIERQYGAPVKPPQRTE